MASVGDYVQVRKKDIRGEVTKKDHFGWCMVHDLRDFKFHEEHDRDLIVLQKGSNG